MTKKGRGLPREEDPRLGVDAAFPETYPESLEKLDHLSLISSFDRLLSTWELRRCQETTEQAVVNGEYCCTVNESG